MDGLSEERLIGGGKATPFGWLKSRWEGPAFERSGLEVLFIVADWGVDESRVRGGYGARGGDFNACRAEQDSKEHSGDGE